MSRHRLILVLICVAYKVCGRRMRPSRALLLNSPCAFDEWTTFAMGFLNVEPPSASFNAFALRQHSPMSIPSFIKLCDKPVKTWLWPRHAEESCQSRTFCHMREKDGNEADFDEIPIFDVTKSTEDNYGVPHFTGRYAHIRPLLDYTWHRTYHPSRIEVQDELIAKFAKPPGNDLQPLFPWVVFTAGAMGVGKGFIRKWMVDNGYLPIGRFVTVDPDAIRASLPEWPDYVKANPETAGYMTQKEAGCIAEIIGFAALHDRRNVIFDGTLRDLKFYRGYFHRLRQNFPGIRIMIIHVVADREAVLQRAEERGKLTGRVVPQEQLIESIEATPKSVQALAHLADFVCRVENSPGKDPTVFREPGAPHPSKSIQISWELFNKLWMKLDTDGDGALSTEDVQTAISMGLLTEEALATVDLEKDCNVTVADIEYAKKKAAENAELRFK